MRQWVRGLALLVLVGCWVFAPRPAPSAEPVPQAPPERPEGEAGAVADPPPDLDAARDVAGRFAVALFTDDRATLLDLATAEYAATLPTAAPGPDGARSSPTATVEAVVTEAQRRDAVALEVLVGREAGGVPRLELLRVVTVRTPAGWRVGDASF